VSPALWACRLKTWHTEWRFNTLRGMGCAPESSFGFPGVHYRARFQVCEDESRLAMDVTSKDGQANVSFSARISGEWRGTPSFDTFDEVSEFFRKGDCGFSCTLRGDELEGLQLKTLEWSMVPMDIESQRCSFYSDPQRFPAGSLEFDCGLLMRGFLTSGINLVMYPNWQ
jgi:hypothetical protein